jgi:hypothetical protein
VSAPGLVSLASLRLQAQQKADMVNSQFVTTREWNQYLTNSYKELYDLLIAAYGNDYFVQTPYLFASDGVNNQFALPSDFYKILGLDLVLTTTPQGCISLKRFNFNERNKLSYPAVQTYYGSNLRYRLAGNFIFFEPTPTTGQNFQLWYVPEPQDLQINFVSALASSSPTVACSDTSLLTVGMQLSSTTGITAGTTIQSITTNTSITMSANATATVSPALIQAWNDSVTFDGISGWEEYVIVDAAIKAMLKEESDASALMAQKQALLKRLEDMAANRDANQPITVSDTQGADFSDGWGFGGGFNGY